jgi:NTE family protein
MIAFVLSGGGSLGAIQAGMLEALLERDIEPDALVGTSIGAANAAFLAADPTLPRARALSDLWRSLKPRQIFPLGPIRTLNALRRDGSLFPTAPLRQLIERHSPYSHIQRARIPLRIVATDLADGTEVVFDSGPVADAVLASTALPGVFPPHRVSGRLYLDGGLVDHVPLAPAIAMGADTIYVLSCIFLALHMQTIARLARCWRIRWGSFCLSGCASTSSRFRRTILGSRSFRSHPSAVTPA